MTVQQLRPPVITGHVAAARAALTAAAAEPVSALTRVELPETLAALAALEAQAAALRLEVLAEADARRVADEAADTGTDVWAARLTGTTRGVMSGGLRLARLLRERYDVTRQALATGGINEAQMRVIVQAAESMPAAVTQAQRTEAETTLVCKAAEGMNPRRLRQAGRRMLDSISRELADQHEADTLMAEERRAEVETWLTLSDNGDGTFSGRFTIPELHGSLLQAALERLSSPRRWAVNSEGRTVTDPTIPGCGPGLNYTEGLGSAFCELVEHLPTSGHAHVAANLLVHVAHERLIDGLGGARLDTGTKISIGEARRLACNAGILPVVLGGRSEPLDVGRERRLHTKAQRRAIATRFETCASEGCERPFAWCEIHHPHAWADGGRTSVDNALPLCGWHHRRAHDERYTLRRLPNGDVRFRRRT